MKNKTSKKSYQIPFDEQTGNMLSYPEVWKDIEWKDVYEFADTLTYFGYGRGMSSIVLFFKDSKGIEYPMFISDFHDVMILSGMNDNRVSGKWTFCKRGQNYGLKMVQN